MATSTVASSRSRTPPTIKGWNPLRTTLAFRQDPLRFLLQLSQQCGDISQWRLLAWPVYHVNHPDYIKYILQSNHPNYNKDLILYKIATPLLGHGLLTSEGDFWLRQRRLIQPAFNRRHLDGYGAVMIDCARHLLAEWRDGETRELSAEMTRLTLEIAARTLFGAEAGTDAREVGEAMAVAHASFEN